MALKIALIDKNEIMQKMLSHCLHYFGADVHRFDGPAEFPAEAPFDLIFIDKDMKTGGRPAALSLRARAGQTPVVVLGRNGEDDEDPDLKSFPQAKKPIDGRRIRDLVAQLAPNAQGLKIHPFLQYPGPEEDEEKPLTEKELSLKTNGAPLQTASLQGASLQTAGEAAHSKTAQAALELKAANHKAEPAGSTAKADLQAVPSANLQAQAAEGGAQRERQAQNTPAEGGLDLPELSQEEKANFSLSPSQPKAAARLATAGSASPAGGLQNSHEAAGTLNIPPSTNEGKEAAAGGSVSGSGISGSGIRGASAAEKSPAGNASVVGGGKEQTQTKTVLIESRPPLQSDLPETPGAAPLKEPSHKTRTAAGPFSALKRDSLDLDESTKNDLGPAALVNAGDKGGGSSNFPVLSGPLKSFVKRTVQESAPDMLREAVLEDNKGLIKDMLEKYSDTLEFEQTLSDAVKSLGEAEIKKLFSNNAENIVKKSIEAYMESAHLKKFMERELRPLIQDSLKNQMQEGGALSKDKLLPLLKEALEGEIKNLLNESKEF